MNGISSEEFFNLIDKGWQIIPTDKQYKLYLDNGEEIKRVFMDTWNDDAKEKFIKYFNEKRFSFAHFGKFHVLPFFMQQEP